MKTLIVTNYDVSRTVQRINWFRKHKYYEISMQVLMREVPNSWKQIGYYPEYIVVKIRGYKFRLMFVEHTEDALGHPLYEIILQQIGHTHKRLNKQIFQYTDIETSL